MSSNNTFEPVLFVLDYWDQPRAGIALYDGVPHRFYCPFEESRDDYANHYLIKEITEEALMLEREAWDLYYGHGPSPELPSILPAPIPRFPEAKLRYNEIETLLAPERNLESGIADRVNGMFVRRESTTPFWSGRKLWAVQWSQ